MACCVGWRIPDIRWTRWCPYFRFVGSSRDSDRNRPARSLRDGRNAAWPGAGAEAAKCGPRRRTAGGETTGPGVFARVPEWPPPAQGAAPKWSAAERRRGCLRGRKQVWAGTCMGHGSRAPQSDRCAGLRGRVCDMESYFTKFGALRRSVRGRASYLERNAAAFPKLNARKSRLGRC